MPRIRPCRLGRPLEATQRGVQVRVEADHALSVNGDPAMLRQALLNLALNACQAMPNGVDLTIVADRTETIRASVAEAFRRISSERDDRI